MTNRIADQVSDPATDGAAPRDGQPAEGAKAVVARRVGATRGANGRSRKPGGPTAGGSAAKTASKVPPLQNRAKAKPAVAKRAPIQLNARATAGNLPVVAAAGAAPSALVRSMRQHAVPAALVGSAIAWYLLQTGPAREAQAKLLGQAKRAGDAVGEALSGVGHTAGAAYEHASGTTREAMGTAAGSVGHAAETAAEAVHDGAVTLTEYAKSGLSSAATAIKTGAGLAGETAQASYRRGQQVVADSWEQHPLVVGASLLAAGVTAGMFLPAPRQSGALLTRASADLSRKLGQKAGELLDKGRSAVGLASVVPEPVAAAPKRVRRPAKATA